MTQDATPLMAQYQSIKAEHPDAVLFFRVGDFYEMFDEEAIEVSSLLNLTLTHKQENPMCGVPFHSAKSYIAKLLRLGKKVAICEQTEAAKSNSQLQKREVVETITPGTATEEAFLETERGNFVASVCVSNSESLPKISFARIDISTADFAATSGNFEDAEDFLAKELGRAMPREVLYAASLDSFDFWQKIRAQFGEVLFSRYQDWNFAHDFSFKRLKRHFATLSLQAFDLADDSAEIDSAGMLLDYVAKISCSSLSHVQNLVRYRETEFLELNESAQRNLEICANLRDGSKRDTLLEAVDKTICPMGHRILRKNLLSPLTDCAKIERRQSLVKFFFDDKQKLECARTILRSVFDIERLASRVSMKKANARDLLALGQSLTGFLHLFSQNCLAAESFCGDEKNLAETAQRISSLIENSVVDSPSFVFNEGNLIKSGVNSELDRLKNLATNSKSVLEEYAAEEREKTGIASLKIHCNRLNGYYIEVSRPNLRLAPPYFIRKRSMANSDYFTTERLRKIEDEIVSAEEKIVDLEREIFFGIRDEIALETQSLLKIAQAAAETDYFQSIACNAKLCGWVCPQVDDSDAFEVEGGRHPVVESKLPSGEFIPNDLSLTRRRFALITGPNMAGKSTFLRQNALIALLAQAGSFVPAKSARIGIVRKIFCRVGAQDNLAKGESTFLVEMNETGNILRCADEKSLVLMDEIGRGTSTEDGLSIAQAVVEFLLEKKGVKTLFATHYHELTRMKRQEMEFLCPDVLDEGGQIVFTRKMRAGASENSYGIHVARLAGLPETVVSRAERILAEIQAQKKDFSAQISLPADFAPPPTAEKNDDFSEIAEEIAKFDINCATPLQALQKIDEWRKKVLAKLQ